MRSISKQTELSVRLDKDSGELERLMAIVASAQVETLASCTYYDRDCAVMLLVSDNAEKVAQILRESGISFARHSVLLVAGNYEPLLAAQLRRTLADANISVLYSHVSKNEMGKAFVVFKTNDDERAVRQLSADQMIYAGTGQRTAERHVVPAYQAA